MLKFLMAVSVGTTIAAGVELSAQAQPRETPPKQSEMFRYLNAFGDAVEKIRRDYVDAPDDRKLIEAAIKGMLQSLEGQNTYYDADDFKRQQEQTRGAFGGLGIEVRLKDGLVEVVTPIDETPGARAGLQAGDLITQVNEKPLKGLSLAQAVAEMRGPVGTTAKLKVISQGRADPFDIEIVRETIKIKSVRTRAENDVGYIRITTFNEQTLGLLRSGARELTDQIGRERVKGFVLDLRNCPGGLFDVVVAVADEFLEQGEIVSQRGRKPGDIKRLNAKPGDITGRKLAVVLINGGTAAGAEIVAGALRDHRRALVVGTRSFGNGSASTFIPIKELGGAMRLTTFRFATPVGRLIEGQGIEPDHVVEPEPRDGASTAQPAGPRSGLSSYVPTDPSKDRQLRFALELLRSGRTPGPR